jgi:hypothetical protein
MSEQKPKCEHCGEEVEDGLVEIKVGQIWRDKDKRREQNGNVRTFTVHFGSDNVTGPSFRGGPVTKQRNGMHQLREAKTTASTHARSGLLPATESISLYRSLAGE